MDNEIHQKLVFYWRDKNGSEQECTLHNRTVKDAIPIAKHFGFIQPKWYNPWTWGNDLLTVDHYSSNDYKK